MSNNPLNLAVRFLLELGALAAMAYWGWTTHDGLWRFLWAVGLPLLAAALWGTLRVPGDPGDAPVAIPGAFRLFLEFIFFATAVWCIADAGRQSLAVAFAAITLLHYLASYDRVLRFLRRSP